MPVRRIDRKEMLECEKIQSIAFAYPLDVEKYEKEMSESKDQENNYMAFINDDNIITACVELPEHVARYEDSWVRMVGIGGVASLPEYRYGGAIRQIIEESIRQMADNDTVFSALYPFSNSYYRQFGYELCQMSVGYEVSMKELSNFKFTGKAKMFQVGDSLDDFKAISEAYFSRYNMAIKRSDAQWKKVLGNKIYKERLYTYLLENENGPSAYFVLTVDAEGNNGLNIGKIRDMAFTSPSGLFDILGFLYRLSAQYESIRFTLPSDVPIAAIVNESHLLKCNLNNQQMSRVINVKKALELKRHFDGASYTINVEDKVLPENNGIFIITCKDNEVSVIKDEKALTADLTLNIGTLTQLLLGFLTIDEAVYKNDVHVRSNIETLRKIFVKQNVFLTDFF